MNDERWTAVDRFFEARLACTDAALDAALAASAAAGLPAISVSPTQGKLLHLLARAMGAPATLALGGVCCLAAAAVFAGKLPALRRQVRPIYIKIGIIPEVANGIQTATDLTSPPEE